MGIWDMGFGIRFGPWLYILYIKVRKTLGKSGNVGKSGVGVVFCGMAGDIVGICC